MSEEAITVTSELVEVGLDSILNDGLLKEIPIISTVISTYRIGKGLKERFYIKKLAAFINELNRGIANQEKLKSYKNKIKANPSFRAQEAEYLLILLDRYIDMEKSKYLAKLFLAYLDGKLTWKQLSVYAEMLDRFINGDLEMLQKKYFDSISVEATPDSLLRLISLGLAVEVEKERTTPTTVGYISIPVATEKDYSITDLGRKLLEIIV